MKDKLMSRMAAAYSLQKMRKALSDLRNNVAAQEAQKLQKEAQSNFTSNFRENNNGNNNPSANSGTDDKTDEKRNGIHNNIDDGECEYYIQKEVRNHGGDYIDYVKYHTFNETAFIKFFS